MATVLVIGAGGQLGQCLRAVSLRRNIDDVFFPEEGTADILNVELLRTLFDQVKPRFVINCAAYTAVDKAEDEADIATAVNEIGARNLAKICKAFGATLIHVSTDFVFEGTEVKLLGEDDIAEPINVYGATKLAGELAIAEELDEYVILRTAWLYSEFANNFVKTMLKLGAEREEINIIADQVGTPTYAIDLADVIFEVILSPSKHYGLYHFSNEGVTSWFDFAKAIFDFSGTSVIVNPIPTSAYPTKAKRPHFSVMDKRKIKADYGVSVPYWLDSLRVCVKAIKSDHQN
jgi:dTDP-4-dehydrorhamnose reductase